MSTIPLAKVTPLQLTTPLSTRVVPAAPLAGLVPPQHRGFLLSVLVNAASPMTCGGRPVLYPLWAEEALNRAINMCQLTLMLEWRRWHGVDTPVDYQYELARAGRLATCFQALDINDEAAVLPCAEILYETASCLVELFGPAVGQVILTAELDQLALPAYRRRALVLAAAALVSRTLLHGFRQRSEGQIVITLGRDDSHHALFFMEDDGYGFGPEHASGSHEIIAGLTALLEADVVYRHSDMGGTAAEVRFPIGSTV